VTGERHDYLPWRNLNDVIPIINDHFGYSRIPVKWEVDLGLVDDDDPAAFYSRGGDKIVFGPFAYSSDRIAAHEYTHALHHKAMGGIWETDNCSRHFYHRPSSYTCAFSEGLAQYGSWVGAPHDWPYPLETIPDTLRGLPTTPKPKVEGHVAALFNDLIDGVTGGLPGNPIENDEPEDKTHYHPHYVMKVFATCEVKHPHPIFGDWKKRDDVSDFVWCLENRVNDSIHEEIFPGIETPHDAREEAIEPSDWNADNIRSTWLWNMQ